MLEKMLSGKMSMKEYVSLLKSDFSLQKELNAIIPEDAKKSPNHLIWKRVSYDFISKYDFDLYKCVVLFHRLDNSISDNLNIFGLIYRLYAYLYPNFSFTTRYHDAHSLLLDLTKDCYEGPEVSDLIFDIINECLDIKSKTTRKKEGENRILDAFHITDKKQKPRWIQGAEWPMGANSPLKFINQKRYKEYAEYLFIDVDTNEERVIVQHF